MLNNHKMSIFASLAGILRKFALDTVNIMKYYVAKKFRAYRRGGVVLITIAIRKIEAKYSAVKLYITEDNPHNRRFYAYYFKEAFSEGKRYFIIEADTRNHAESE